MSSNIVHIECPKPTTKLEELIFGLEKWRHENPRIKNDEEYVDRHTYCHLMFLNKNDNKYHKLEVRGFSYTKDSLNVEIVNWSIAAGTATAHITDTNAHLFEILEDNPTLKVLYD